MPTITMKTIIMIQLKIKLTIIVNKIITIIIMITRNQILINLLKQLKKMLINQFNMQLLPFKLLIAMPIQVIHHLVQQHHHQQQQTQIKLKNNLKNVILTLQLIL